MLHAFKDCNGFFQVKKMGGEIKVMKKNGPGTLMRLYLLLSAPADGPGQHCEFDFQEYNLSVSQ